MDHRIACQLLISCHAHQSALERERAQQQDLRGRAQQDPRATCMELQMCWASDVTQELRMMHAEQISSFPHAGSRALSLLENIELVASKASLRRCETTVVSEVQRFHVALAEKGSPKEFLATEL